MIDKAKRSVQVEFIVFSLPGWLIREQNDNISWDVDRPDCIYIHSDQSTPLSRVSSSISISSTVWNHFNYNLYKTCLLRALQTFPQTSITLCAFPKDRKNKDESQNLQDKIRQIPIVMLAKKKIVIKPEMCLMTTISLFIQQEKWIQRFPSKQIWF